ncbi:hypothetical protein EKG37_10430 [Robertmurraya yapensis]|uniref:Uncharacterized protein n=1 Tax=Bacillus yapensis TaxID=2492960 RepID=A0A3S0KQ44_9BACI|nr:hypothetical protein [Bacillus sp. PS06]MBU5341516.1 transposase [Caldifermentibacillus hisashii]RTR31909.1 hypothetical protein EKG37_10430 [Bacillus yapensis]TKS95922.1 hypothetical protein FAR12_10430 [Bacillus yapensis]
MDTWLGTLDLKIRKPHKGSYYPSMPKPRKRIEKHCSLLSKKHISLYFESVK